MSDRLQPLRVMVAEGITRPFVLTVESELRWGAYEAWRGFARPDHVASRLVNDDGRILPNVDPTDPMVGVELERLMRDRRLAGNRALLAAARAHGLPAEWRPIGGGHRAVFVRTGPLILGIDRIRYVEDHPAEASFRRKLASGAEELRQLYLPFPDWPIADLDPVGATYCIVEHLVPCIGIAQAGHELTALRVIVPSRDLHTRILTVDLLGEAAQERFFQSVEPSRPATVQEDRVRPRLRSAAQKKRRNRDGKTG